MVPYYDHAGITIYHGDCRDVLPDVTADCVVTDPPYGLGVLAGIHEGSNDYASYDDTYEKVRDVIVPIVCSLIKAVSLGRVEATQVHGVRWRREDRRGRAEDVPILRRHR